MNETMIFFSNISNQDNGFGLRRWYFCELKVKRNHTLIRQVRVTHLVKNNMPPLSPPDNLKTETANKHITAHTHIALCTVYVILL